jgi:hypothetical protein
MATKMFWSPFDRVGVSDGHQIFLVTENHPHHWIAIEKFAQKNMVGMILFF